MLTFSASSAARLLEKIEKKRNFVLDERREVAQGIVAPQDTLNAAGSKKLRDKFPVGTGIFNLTTSEKESLKLSSVEHELLKPFYNTTELGKYYGSPNNKLWVIYTDSSF